MGSTKDGANGSRVAGVSGLVGIRSGAFFYVGKLTTDDRATMGLGDNDPAFLHSRGGYVDLVDAYEIIVSHRQGADGTVAATIVPIPVPPFQGAAPRLTVRVDALLDLSREAGFVAVDRSMTGGSGVLLPGMPGPVRR